MERTSDALSIDALRHQFADIEFPEYQREPDVWSRDQKQRLIDSILRDFDISSIYLYLRDDGGWECIDGRQRLNAIMSFLGENPIDEVDNGFALKSHNEIATTLASKYEALDGRTFSQLRDHASPLSDAAIDSILTHELTVIYLSGAKSPEEFNLQFLRLNLGTLINAGEKLNAMVGAMRNIVFEDGGLGDHPFLELVRIPTRRFSKETAAAQVLLQIFSKTQTGGFARARHFDLQRFFKSNAEVLATHPLVLETQETLDALASVDVSHLLRNRAMTVSVVIFSWQVQLYKYPERLEAFPAFLRAFVGRLRWQVKNMKDFTVDDHYPYLVDFQRHLTQASVEKPAVTQRHDLLVREWNTWRQHGRLTGDAEYEADEGAVPPSLDA